MAKSRWQQIEDRFLRETVFPGGDAPLGLVKRIYVYAFAVTTLSSTQTLSLRGSTGVDGSTTCWPLTLTRLALTRSKALRREQTPLRDKKTCNRILSGSLSNGFIDQNRRRGRNIERIRVAAHRDLDARVRVFVPKIAQTLLLTSQHDGNRSS